MDGYGDPGADPVEEWGVGERMSDMITPASLRAHADHMERVHLDGISAAELLQEAARLEAESARDEEAEKYAKVHHLECSRKYPALSAWDELPEIAHVDNIGFMRAVLDRLAADGRLLPEGGTALTTEAASVLEARAALREVATDVVRSFQERESNRELYDVATHRLVDQLAAVLDTPPAATVQDSGEPELCPSTHRYFTCTRELGHEGKHEANDGRIVARSWPTEVVLDSGPDGTPEKPWPNLNEVPAGVTRVHDRDGDLWERVGGHWGGMAGCCPTGQACRLGHPVFAPFVRVDGDKA
ncbi:hypothetical protein 7S3_55 [uncultured Caudovirales phage]|uniref:Uncharacterized protein n=1 Tax=uncultured Caudovirales phage TaxID=2100421 RepID=A0A2H4J5D2_9CAUD|nr:hypothetical protein 7S3_55 [uncultured Caudovirales phage]